MLQKKGPLVTLTIREGKHVISDELGEVQLDARGSFLLECLAEHIADQAATSDRSRKRSARRRRASDEILAVG